MLSNDIGIDHYQSLLSANEPIRTEDTIIPIIHEEFQLGKMTIETAKIQVSKKVAETAEEINVPCIVEQYNINRIPVNQVVATPPSAVRYEGDTMIFSVIKEVLVVEKRYEIIEEVHVTKQTTETIETQHITLRKEEVTIERTPINEGSV